MHQQEPEPAPLPALPAPPARQQRDWDVSRDPQLAKQLEVAKRLGQKAPPQESNRNIDAPELITRFLINQIAAISMDADGRL